MRQLLRVIRPNILFATIINIIFLSNIQAQNLLKSRHTSYYTYFYHISNKEAKEVFTEKSKDLSQHLFHTLIDSVETDSTFIPDLPIGHYLQVFTSGSRLNFDLITIQKFDVKILNNSSDLQIVVFDSLGTIITNAEVTVNSSRINFDEKTQSYLRKKTNKKGLLQVTYRGLTSFQYLNRDYNNSGFIRTSNKIIYKTPVKYIWIPTKFALLLPYDAVRSLIKWYPVNTIDQTRYFFVKTYEKIACKFDDYYCDDKYEKYKSFMVFNKPKYRPGDTIKFKAFITNRKGKPFNEPLKVKLWNYDDKYYSITQLENYRPGGYEYQFALSDTFNLKLDKRYYICLCSLPFFWTLLNSTFLQLLLLLRLLIVVKSSGWFLRWHFSTVNSQVLPR